MNMRWNLDALYTSFESEVFIRDVQELDTRIKALIRWVREELAGTSPQELSPGAAGDRIVQYIDLYTGIRTLYSGLFSYAALTFSVDASNAAARKYIEILEQKIPELTKATVPFERWIAGVDDLEPVVENSGILKDHTFFLQEMKENSTYLLSDREEVLAAQLKNTGSNAWEQLWNVLTSTVKVAIETDGSVQELPLPVVRNMAYSPKESIRKNAYEAELTVYKKFSESAAAALNSIKGEVLTMAALRGYNSPLEMTLIRSRMDNETLQAMLTAIREYLPEFRSYFLKKAEILGHKGGLPFYDLFAPVGTGELHFEYDEAKEFIVTNFRKFSSNLAAFAEKAFSENWIDAEQREGKQGGAFCENLHVIGESRIMTNFDGSFSGVTTLAHELGHAYHGYCLKDERFLNADYPMPLAETASIFCETIIFQAALRKAAPQEAFTILENSIQSDAQVIVDIYSRFLFESELFEKRKTSSLSVEELKDIMTRAQQKAYGEGLDAHTLHPYMWACKPHYYYADFNFYNFPYAFGLLFAKGLYAEYLAQGESFIEKYDTLLRETGKNSIRNVTAMMGIDAASPEFWRSSLEVVKRDIGDFLLHAETGSA